MSAKTRHSHSFAKAVSWRMFGTLDTFIIGYLVTGKLRLAGSIVGVELLTKTLLYYLHERAWDRISWGKHKEPRRPT